MRVLSYTLCNCGVYLFFFFNDTATTEIYTLSLHDALPISVQGECPYAGEQHRRWSPGCANRSPLAYRAQRPLQMVARSGDRKSTRLNSSHANISYAVFCLKKKKKNHNGLILYLWSL